MDFNSKEMITALKSLEMASKLCEMVRADLPSQGAILKSDRSPVTVADYGSQAIICKYIKTDFPDVSILAEENSLELRKPDNAPILEQVTHYVNTFIPNSSPAEICSWIDSGSKLNDKNFWALDPIDGTKGFLRGDQYAIALAYIEDGHVQMGVMACPNLYVDKEKPFDKKGCIFFAVRGRGSIQMEMFSGNKKVLSVMKVKNPEEASFTESYEPEHSDHLLHKKIAQRLNISAPSLKMDSQAKYGIVARGEATFYLRIPLSHYQDYKEKVWDHAAGSIIIEEAGGKVTDILGKALDFSCGARLEKNHGILVSNGILHEIILKVINQSYGVDT